MLDISFDDKITRVRHYAYDVSTFMSIFLDSLRDSGNSNKLHEADNLALFDFNKLYRDEPINSGLVKKVAIRKGINEQNRN